MTDQFSLSWNNYQNSITTAFNTLREDEDFVDVTLSAEGKTLKAHKVVLSACSPYFKDVLKGIHLWQHAVLVLKDVPYPDLLHLLEFVYAGHVNVGQENLQSFLKTAELLRIKGLTEERGFPPGVFPSSVAPPKHKQEKRVEKRRRTSIVDEKSEGKTHNSGLEKRSRIVDNESSDSKKGEATETRPDVVDELNVAMKEEPVDDQTDIISAVKYDTVGEYSHGNTETIDPSQFVKMDMAEDEGDDPSKGLLLRQDLMTMFGERGRCHFCSLLCVDREALTTHLKCVHQPPKHALCENCENFFHVCAIQRHRTKCHTRYVSDK